VSRDGCAKRGGSKGGRRGEGAVRHSLCYQKEFGTGHELGLALEGRGGNKRPGFEGEMTSIAFGRLRDCAILKEKEVATKGRGGGLWREG